MAPFISQEKDNKADSYQMLKGESLMIKREGLRGKAANFDDEEPAREQETLLSAKLRRGLVVGKKVRPCTPSPAWKLEENSYKELEEDVRQRKSVSARKLGANLWEVQDLSPVVGMRRKSGRTHRQEDVGRDHDDLLPFRSSDQPPSAGSLRRNVVSSLMQHRKSNERKSNALQHVSSATYSSSMEVTPFKPGISPGCLMDMKGRIGEPGYNLKTSTELLKVLNRIWSLEEQHSSNVAVVRALKLELEHASVRIQELMQERKDHHCEIDELMNQFAEDKVVRKNKERDRMKAAVQSIRQEIDDERRLRRRSENLHRKLGKELSETKTALSNAIKDVENEKKSSGLLEDLCVEFARGIGKYEKEISELKKNNTTDCELKFDGLLLCISEAWLNERLQMQMAESCSEKVKNGTIVGNLEEEIISFLRARRANNIKDDNKQQHRPNLRRQSLESLHLNGAVSAPRDMEDDDSIASDLHCFELNMEKTEELESTTKSCSGRKTIGYHRSIKSKSLSMLSDADSGIVEADKGEAFDSSCDHDRNVDVVNGSNSLIHCMVNNNHLENASVCKIHHANYRGEINMLSGRGFGDNITENFKRFEISECSSKLPHVLKENTLKAKLLEARLEGRHARLRALKDT